MGIVKLSGWFISLICSLAGLILGVLAVFLLTYITINKNLTDNGKFVTVPYCEIKEFIGEEICSESDDCRPVETCLSGWETRDVPVWDHFRSLIRQNIYAGMGMGVFVGLLLSLAINDNLKYKKIEYNDNQV